MAAPGKSTSRTKFFYVASIFAVSFGVVSLMWQFKEVGWILIVFGLMWVAVITAFAHELVTRAERLDQIVRSRTDALEEANRNMMTLLQQLNAFHQISYEMNQKLELREVAQAYVECVFRLLPGVDGVWLWLRRGLLREVPEPPETDNEEPLVVVVQAGHNLGRPAALSILRSENPLVAQCLAQQAPTVENDLPARAREWGWDWLAQSGMQVFSAFPLLLRGDVLGMLGVFSLQPPSREFVSQLQLSVNQLTVALEKARLLKETRRRAEELAAANAELRQLDAMKDWFVSSVSHELRTPLTSIRSFSEILERYEDLEPNERREFASIIREESERLSQMIDDVLDLAKISRGAVTLKPRFFSIRPLVEKCHRLFAKEAQERRIRFEYNVPDRTPNVYADEDAIARVLNNLISNAFKFTPDGGRIQIVAEPEAPVASPERFVAILVRDTGIGIAKKDQAHIFERFTQVSNAIGGKPRGAGIGLAICREIVEKSRGQIWVESAPGRGSTFGFTLPVSPPPGDTTVGRPAAHRGAAAPSTAQQMGGPSPGLGAGS